MNQKTSSQQQLLELIASILSEEKSGTLEVKSDMGLQKFLFSSGALIGATSNELEEYPGYYLHRQNILSNPEFLTYKQTCSNKGVRQWDLIIDLISLSEKDLDYWKYKYALYLFQKSFENQSNQHMQFSVKQFPENIPVLQNKFLFATDLAIYLCHEPVLQNLSCFQDSSSMIQKKDLTNIEIDSPEIKGTLNLLERYETLGDIINNSLLSKKEITTVLITLSLLGSIELENHAHYESKNFIKTLSENQKQKRNAIIEMEKQFNQQNLYQWMGLPKKASKEAIVNRYHDLAAEFENTFEALLFAPNEKNLHTSLLNSLRNAYSVLTNTNKKKEYDSFLDQNKEQDFFTHSLTLQDDQIFSDFQFLIAKKEIEKAVQLGFQHTQKRPQLLPLTIAWIETVLQNEFIDDPAYQKHCLFLMKYHIQHHPDRYEPYFLLAKFSTLLNQPENAFKAYQKALHKRPDIEAIRQYMVKTFKEKGVHAVLKAIYETMDRLNHYQILAVDPKSTPREIHRAYRYCAKYYHPDLFFQSDAQLHTIATSVFKQMVQAYQTLKKIQDRQIYDVSIHSQKTGTPYTEIATQPNHFKAKEYFLLGCKNILEQNYSSAVLHLEFALQCEPDSEIIAYKLNEAKNLKKAH